MTNQNTPSSDTATEQKEVKKTKYPVKDRLYLIVPKERKEEVKKFGAKFDARKGFMKWYIPDGKVNGFDTSQLPQEFLPKRLQPKQENNTQEQKEVKKTKYPVKDRLYLTVPKERKEEVKKLGAKFDARKGFMKWYIPDGKVNGFDTSQLPPEFLPKRLQPEQENNTQEQKQEKTEKKDNYLAAMQDFDLVYGEPLTVTDNKALAAGDLISNDHLDEDHYLMASYNISENEDKSILIDAVIEDQDASKELDYFKDNFVPDKNKSFEENLDDLQKKVIDFKDHVTEQAQEKNYNHILEQEKEQTQEKKQGRGR